MAEHSSVKIIEVCRVAPLQDSPETLSLPLTFFDLAWLRFPPVQRIFFYELSSSETPFVETIVKLKKSLSNVLRFYLPLAGNLVWPQQSYKPIIQFSDGDGVLLTVAESDADFHHLSGDGFRKAELYHPLVPKLPESHERVAVIALQLTLFQNRGFSIGITTHHAILDGRTSTSFIKSWARICNLNVTEGSSLPATGLAPFYDRKVINDPAGLDVIFANEWQDTEEPNKRTLKVWSPKAPPNLIRCTFDLTNQKLQKIRQWVVNKREKKESFHLSSFTAAAAYSWVCATKSVGLRNGKVIFVFTADARSRLEPPVPESYFGNCLVGCKVSVERNDLCGENGVLVAIDAISEAIKSMEGGILKGAEKWVSIMKASKGEPGREMNTVAGSPRFEVYSADFGWGKPKKVEIVSIDGTGAFSFTDSRNGDGGIEIGLARKQDEMERFAALFAEGLAEAL